MAEWVKQKGYAKLVKVYEDDIFVDTNTGEGYDAVLKKMSAHIDLMTRKIRLSGFEQEDIRQWIVSIILDGIRNYDPAYEVKLSTFLYIHIKNRIASRIKQEVREASNATYIEPSFRFKCKCGFWSSATKKDLDTAACFFCRSTIDKTWKIYLQRQNPISLDYYLERMSDDIINEQIDSGRNELFQISGSIINTNDVDANLDLYTILHKQDEKTKKLACLMYNEGYNIGEAADKIGINCWTAALKIRKLGEKKTIRTYFNK